MPTPLRTFPSGPAALAALAVLWRSGVVAWIERRDERAGLIPGLARVQLPLPTFFLHADPVDRPRAEAVLLEFDQLHSGGLASDADDQHPNLLLLDPGLAPPCPACAATLPMRADATACPACALPVDVVELIVLTHGPEALADAYDPVPILDDASAPFVPTRCRRCDYVLLGLITVGVCPECGEHFDKEDAVQAWFA